MMDQEIQIVDQAIYILDNMTGTRDRSWKAHTESGTIARRRRHQIIDQNTGFTVATTDAWHAEHIALWSPATVSLVASWLEAVRECLEDADGFVVADSALIRRGLQLAEHIVRSVDA